MTATATSSVYPNVTHLPRVREHVFYIQEGHPVVDALVSIVFGEHGMPRLTLVMIRAGGGDVTVKSEVPHRDHRNGSRAYYILPGEAL